MNDNYKNLILALSAFAEEFWLPYEDSLGSLELSIESGQVNKFDLKTELEKALNQFNFDWHELARKSSLLISPSSYENLEIVNYIKFLLFDFLYAERIIEDLDIAIIEKSVFEILQSNGTKNGWTSSYDVYNKVKMKYPSVEYFHLWQIDFIKINVERKLIEEKDREIGLLKLKEKEITS